MGIRLPLLDRKARCPDKFAVSKRPHYVRVFKSAREPCHVQFVL
jgi:hypothetical protein